MPQFAPSATVQSPAAWALNKLLVSAGADQMGYAFANVYTTGRVGKFLQSVGRVVDSITALKALLKTDNPRAFVTGYAAANDGGGGHYCFDGADLVSADNGGTVIVATDGGRWKLVVGPQGISVKQFGAKGDGATNDSAAIAAADVWVAAQGGGRVWFPKGDYRHASTLRPSNRNIWEGESGPARTAATTSPVKISYTGAGGNAVLIQEPTQLTCIKIRNIEFNGANSTGLSNGIFLDAVTNGGAIVGLVFEGCTFCDFGNYQVYHDGTVFDVTFWDCTFHNYNKSTAGDLIHGGPSGVPTQWKFYNCFFILNSAGQWSYRCEAANTVYFNGGSIGPNTTTGNGVSVIGYLGINGTHFEGRDAIQTGTIGIRYIGSLGADIKPSQCSLWGIPVQIGDGTASTARGWIVGGSIGGANGTHGEVWVTAGGSRQGTVLEIGYASGSHTIANDRFTTDGVNEVCVCDGTNGTVRAVFTPTVIGSTVAGAGTYTAQTGVGALHGVRKEAWVRVTWTAHTGTGNIQIGTLPVGFGPSTGTPCASVRMSGVAITAGNRVQAYLDNNRVLQIEQITAAGATSGIPMSASGDIIVNISWLV